MFNYNQFIDIDLQVFYEEKTGLKIKCSKDEEYNEDQTITGDKVVLAVGRKGANRLVKMCNKHQSKWTFI